jgi:hypothetical protein
MLSLQHNDVVDATGKMERRTGGWASIMDNPEAIITSRTESDSRENVPSGTCKKSQSHFSGLPKISKAS